MINDEIKKILEKNRMINDYYNRVDIQNEKTFLQNYGFKDVHTIPKRLKRNESGFLDLNDESFIMNNYISDGHNPLYWFLLDSGDKLLLKIVDFNESSMNLLFEELSYDLLIPCAKYDIASLGHTTYLISPCFTRSCDLMYDYYDISKKKHVDVENLLLKAKKVNQENFIKKILMIDFLTDNKDRFPNNLKVIKRNNKIIKCPLFDNGLYGSNCKYLFVLPTYKDSDDAKDIINYLLSDDVFYKWCVNKILKIDATKYKNEIISKKGIYVDNDTFDAFVQSTSNVKKIISSYK